MDTASAFMYGQIHRDSPSRVFDWVKAAQIIRDRYIVGNLKAAYAGLSNDWEFTGGKIFENGSPVPKDTTYTYLASTWAIPQLSLDGDIFECWVWKKDSPGWDAKTYWPSEAHAILQTSLQSSCE